MNDEDENNTQDQTTTDTTTATADTQTDAPSGGAPSSGGSGGVEVNNPNSADLNSSVDSDEQVELNAQMQQDGTTPLKMPSQAPIPSGAGGSSAPTEGLELADGTDSDVALDSSLQYDAINAEGDAQISFQNGNFGQLTALPQKAGEKINTIQKTIVPLVEVALIELLGNNKAYKEMSFNSNFTVSDNNEPQFEVHMTYGVELFIGTDIAQEDIAQDAKYILDRVSVVPNVNWTKCEIDCTSGEVNIDFII